MFPSRYLILLIFVLVLISLALLLIPIERLPIIDPSIIESTADPDMGGLYLDDYYDGSTEFKDPGTFARELQKLLLQLISSTTTSTTNTALTSPVPTTISPIASSAAAVGTGTLIGAGARALILTVIYVV
jgi:hypothetical protein